MPRATTPRLPLAPARPYLRAIAADRHACAAEPAALAAVLGVTIRTAQRWHHADELPEYRADELAAALDLHPLNLWPEWADLDQGATTP